jgi:hypothetical protein
MTTSFPFDNDPLSVFDHRGRSLKRFLAATTAPGQLYRAKITDVGRLWAATGKI